MGCFHSFCIDNTLKKHGRLCDKHDYCQVEMPKENEKILKYNHGEKPLKTPFTIYFELECYYQNCVHVKIILKSLMQIKKPSISLLVTHGF